MFGRCNICNLFGFGGFFGNGNGNRNQCCCFDRRFCDCFCRCLRGDNLQLLRGENELRGRENNRCGC